MANEAAAKVADVPIEEVLGRNIHDFKDTAQHNAPVFEKARQAMIRGEFEFVPEEKIMDGKGIIRTFQMHWIPYTDVYTDKKAVLEVATDISEIKRMESELLEKRRLEHDLEIAKDIQSGLLPREQLNIHEYDIAGWNQPADETGGDFFDWFELPDGRSMVSIADVTGHGIGPALVASMCRAYIRAASHDNVSVTALLNNANALLSADMPDGRFVTAAAGFLDAKNHTMTFLSAGHGPVLFYSARDQSIDSYDADGIPLGLDDQLVYGPPREFNFNGGDVLVLVTDGFFEWRNEEEEEYGIQRLQEVIQNSAHLPANEIISSLHEAVLDFVGNVKQADDLTAVIVKRSES
jgi:phosphoserine phosphatase